MITAIIYLHLKESLRNTAKLIVVENIVTGKEVELSKIPVANFVASLSQENVYTQNTAIQLVEQTRQGKTMADKVLDADYIRNLLAGDKKKAVSKEPPKVQFATEYKPDPLKKPQVGYPLPGDKGDIWIQWRKQGRTGAAELIERWS